MQRKPGFPVANCNIKMPESVVPDIPGDDDWEPQQRRQQLINFGHSQWTFNNWSWSVTKQDLDFVELVNGKYTAGVAAFVNVSVKSFDIHRENVGYATSVGVTKGSAIHRARKCAVTNALRETLLSFGGSVASDLLELLEANKAETPVEPQQENNPNLLNKPTEPKNSQRKDPESASGMRVPPPAIKNAAVPPVALAHPMPANLPARPPANAPRAAAPRPNVSFVVPVVGGVVPGVGGVVPAVGGVVPPLYAPPRLPAPPPPLYPNAYYEYSGPWHFAYEPYERPHGNVNLNFNMPPKNLVVNGRAGSVECKNACRQGPAGPEVDPSHYPPAQNQGCWIKPTIFYDGFWTEQKVKKWVAEQVEKQFPEDASKSSSPSGGQSEPSAPKP
ncbi:DNA repair and recombination protein RAD52-like isoform X1 [Zerene cesonia]|uniref:DNA repair and recombination protein RAD52-like isoform X1 n=1 Tax=Zerene cesonia TaxID=33412 RepID=UPI0018E59830|nr:DNA repair and recombination protein RAD52-like isoform X1 [Zerene cesonia]